MWFLFFFKFYFIFKLYIIVLVLPNIKMNYIFYFLTQMFLLLFKFLKIFIIAVESLSANPLFLLLLGLYLQTDFSSSYGWHFCYFACLVKLYWMLDIISFTLLNIWLLLSPFKECESLCCQEFNLLVNQLDVFKLYF